MEKIVLKDNTEIEVVSASSDSFQTNATPEEMAVTFDKLTAQNMTRFEYQNEKGEAMAIYKDKVAEGCSYQDGVATFTFRSLDETEVRIAALEETVDALLMSDMGV